MIPYLENYEGFSFFIDDDYIWKHNPMSLFYFLDPDNAVACVQYDFKHHDENKMGGEKNVSYPMKLWSSMMIFNNGHEDCRKLTPEVIMIDTMYKDRKKTALVKNNMRLVREIVGPDSDYIELLKVALNCAKNRVVLKQPRYAEPIKEIRKCSHQILGKTIRYDIFMTN